jgi:hypothetical protein
MRIALCFYGQPRNFSSNWDHFRRNIINGNNVDVFFHSWYDPNDRNIHKMTPGFENFNLEESLDNIIPSVTESKKFILEKQRVFNSKLVPATEENIDECWSYSRAYDRDDFIRNRVKAHYSMWYSINKSILLKELYAQENNFEYDCVIVSRFDVSPKIKIDFNSLDLSKVISGYKELPRGEVNDWFMITNNINSNILASVFYSIDFHRNKIVENKGIWTNEAYLRDHLNLFGVEIVHRNFEISF